MALENTYLVGGAVRDILLGKMPYDFDFCVETDSFDSMRDMLTDEGFYVYAEYEPYLTMKVKPPRTQQWQGLSTVDFSVCRKDSVDSDGRRPEITEIGSLEDDLNRRDFTINAFAVSIQDLDMSTHNITFDPRHIVDINSGLIDLHSKTIRFIGSPQDRISHDGLRVLRALRFMVTLGFKLDYMTEYHIDKPESVEAVRQQEPQRIFEELTKMFRYDTFRSIQVLSNIPEPLFHAIFRGNQRLVPSLKEF